MKKKTKAKATKKKRQKGCEGCVEHEKVAKAVWKMMQTLGKKQDQIGHCANAAFYILGKMIIGIEGENIFKARVVDIIEDFEAEQKSPNNDLN